MKLLVIGCGSIGKRHAANAALLAETAVFDLDPGRAQDCAKAAGAVAFSDLDRALAWGADAAIVATPHATHVDVARKAVRAGCHVLIEKPISHRREDVALFLDEAERAGRQVFVVCNMRYHRAVRLLRDNLAAIGEPRYATAHYGNYLPNMRPNADYRALYCARRATGGGVILDAIHEIDYLSWFFGGARVMSASAACLSDLDIDVEDYAVIGLAHRGGARSLLQFDYLRPRKSRGCEIVGSEGVLSWQSDGKAPEHCRVRLFTQARQEWQTLLDDTAFDDTHCYSDMLRDFAGALGGAPSDLLDGRTALAELDVALTALETSGFSEPPVRATA
jgi:predicted dehydrogenase